MPKLIFEKSQDGASKLSSTINYWRLNESSTGPFRRYLTPGTGDFTSTDPASNDIKLNGNTTAYFDGAGNGYLGAGDTLDVGTNNYSFSVWVCPKSFTGKRPLFKKMNVIESLYSDVVGYSFWLEGTVWFANIQYGTIVGQYSNASWDHNLSINEWAHIAFTVDRDNGVVRYYKNGVLSNSAALTVATNGINLNNSAPACLGVGIIIDAVYWYYGNMSDVFFDTARIWAAGEVWQLYKNVG